MPNPWNQDNYPPGVSDRDISRDEPIVCEYCEGHGKHQQTPCCGLDFVEVDNGYQCPSCNIIYETKTCQECAGEGTVYE